MLRAALPRVDATEAGGRNYESSRTDTGEYLSGS